MKRTWILWLAVAAGPLAWMASFGAEFALTGWTCAWQSKLALHVISAVALIIMAAGTWVSFVEWRAIGEGFAAESGGPLARLRTLAVSGIVLNIGFFLVVVGQMIPQFVLKGCE